VTGPATFDEFVGIYDADATLWGEVSYWVGARFGRRHCSLCDVTHGTFRRKPEWERGSRSLPVPFVAFHRNDAPRGALAAALGSLPVVLGRTGDDFTVVLTDEQLASCHGSPSALVELLATAARRG
jgi:hypothetical protein